MTARVRLVFASLVLVVALPAAAAAQSLTLGVKGGVNSATIQSDSSPDIGSRWGAVGGLFLGARITDMVGLQVEGLFSQRGGIDETPGSDVKFLVNYIDVPVMLKLGRASDDGIGFHALAGAQASYKLKAEASSELLGVTVDLDDELEDLDLSAVFGVGVEKGRFSLDALYVLGLSNIATTQGEDAKNRTIRVMVGVRLK